MMKPNLSIATGLRRLSSEKISENPFSAGNISPQGKATQYLKSSYGDFQSKKQLGNSLKGLLSPVDYKLVEMQTKANALKLEEDTAKPSPKGSARLSGHIILNGTEQINEIYSKGSMHQKKKSFDSKVDSQYDDTQGSKTKLPNTNSLSHTRSQTSTNIYLKDVEYVVNPMFSPVNGPPKYITHRQSDSLVDSVSPKMSQAKKTSAAQDGKAGHKLQENADIMLKKESHSAKMMAKSSLNQFFETKKIIEEGSLDEYPASTKAKAIKEKSSSQLPLNRMKDGKKSPSMNVSPRVEAYNSLHAYTATNGVKPVGGEFENFQIAKNKSSLGSLYSRQREENQEITVKGTTAVKSSPKKSGSKGVKKDCFFPKSKQGDAPNMQNKVKKSEIDLKEENEDIHVRPRTTKHSEPNIQKDINNFIFSGFNNQLKRNSAAQIYNSASLVESNLQSTRSAVDRSEKQTFIKEDQKSAKGTKPTSAAEVDVKLTSESNGEDVHTLSKKNSVGQITQNPNAKFLIMRKQVQEKRANRGFKSAGQDMFDLHYYPADLNEKKDHPSGSTKQGSDIQYYLPDTTHTSGKVVGQAQLNEVFARVGKILDTYQKKEKTWEEEKRKLQAEIQMLRNGKQMK